MKLRGIALTVKGSGSASPYILHLSSPRMGEMRTVRLTQRGKHTHFALWEIHKAVLALKFALLRANLLNALPFAHRANLLDALPFAG